MTIIDSMATEMKTYLESDTTLMTLLGGRLVLKYRNIEGDTKFPYITFDHVESGLVDEWPISKGYLRFEIWNYSNESRVQEQIVSRLKQLFHKKIWKNTELTSLRTFYVGSGLLPVNPMNAKILRNFVKFETRFYDTDLA